MEFSTVTKKKKRKTRKCLDEIRKRSRRTMRLDHFKEITQQHENINRAEEPHKLITMNRLTLNKFPKVIRSETVTRPLIEEIKQKSSHNLRGPDKNDSLSKNPECLEHCNSTTSNNSMPMFDLNEESLQEPVGHLIDNPLKNYLKLNNPINVNVSQTPTEPINKMYSTSTSTSLSSQTLEVDHGVELYEELMNKISSHLKKVTSAVIQEDVIKNTKVNLQKLYNKSWSKEYKNENSNKSTLQSPKDPILQNPLDYIRLKHVQQQHMYNDCDLGLSETFSSLSPVAPTSYSPLAAERESTCEVALYDTPQYNYYPHRLHQ